MTFIHEVKLCADEWQLYISECQMMSSPVTEVQCICISDGHIYTYSNKRRCVRRRKRKGKSLPYTFKAEISYMKTVYKV